MPTAKQRPPAPSAPRRPPSAAGGPTTTPGDAADPTTAEECREAIAARRRWLERVPTVQGELAYLAGLAKGKGWDL